MFGQVDIGADLIGQWNLYIVNKLLLVIDILIGHRTLQGRENTESSEQQGCDCDTEWKPLQFI